MLRTSHTRKLSRKTIAVPKSKHNVAFRYVRKAKTVTVRSVPSPDVGAARKNTSIIGKLKAGMLTAFGYHPVESMTSRHKALTKAIKVGRENPLSVFHRLHAIGTLTKRTLPTASRIYRRDRDWIADKFLGK